MKTNMKTKITTVAVALSVLVLLVSCQKNSIPDATGTFEAVETIISAEAPGVIKKLKVHEGQQLKKGQVIGYIDSTELHLQKKALQAQIAATLSQRPNLAKQLAALRTELKNAKTNLNRMENLQKKGAATQKQLDDAQTRVHKIEKQIKARKSSLQIQTTSLGKSTVPITLQIEQIEEKLEDHKIINPVNGTVLATYAEQYETARAGMPLYKIADLSYLDLRAYITGSQFSNIKLGQTVTVKVDDGKDSYRTYEGKVIWISDKAEFTPKTIQTKEERANLVYAIKIRVKNDGYLKIGMYAEVDLGQANKE